MDQVDQVDQEGDQEGDQEETTRTTKDQGL